MAFNYDNYKETEKGYSLGNFVRTGTCLNTMYCGGRDPMEMDNRICPKCGRTIKMVKEKEE